MKSKFCLAVVAALLMVPGVGRAAHLWENPELWWNNLWLYERDEEPKFAANQISLELFGSYRVDQPGGFDDLFQTDLDNGLWGGGAGLNYFVTRHIGIGGDVTMSEGGGAFVDYALGSLYLRLPWETQGLSPYVYGGGGRGIDPTWEWLVHAGVGVEFRVNPFLGIFFDTRYIWADTTTDRLQFRAGLRVQF